MLASTNTETLKRIAIAGSVTFTLCVLLLFTVGRGIAEKIFSLPCGTNLYNSETGQISQTDCTQESSTQPDASTLEKVIFYLLALGVVISPALLTPYMYQLRRRSLLLLIGLFYILLVVYAIVAQ